MIPPPHRILVLRLSSLGDILLATPFLRALRAAGPTNQIDICVKSQYAELLRTNQRIDGLWEYDPATGVGGLRRLADDIRRAQYDLVLDLHKGIRSRLLARWARPRRRAAYRKEWVKRTLLVSFGVNLFRTVRPIPWRYFTALERWRIEPDAGGLELWVDDVTQEKVDTLLTESLARLVGGVTSPLPAPGACPTIANLSSRPFIAIAPGARWAAKRWRPERFAAAARTLADQVGAPILILGGRTEEALGAEVAAALGCPAVDLSGQLGILATGAALRRARLLLTNDSGTMHIAAATGTPVVAIFGPTARELGYFPYGVPARVVEAPLACRPCTHMGRHHCPLGHHLCMEMVTPAEVIAAAGSLLGDPLREAARTPPVATLAR